jgi:hypothetical protein
VPPVSARRLPRVYVILVAAALATLVLEFFRGTSSLGGSPIWPVAEAAVAGAALLVAWRRQHELRLDGTLALACGYQLAWTALHLARGVPSDFDSQYTYSTEGNDLLHGHYHSEYPPGAVLVFAVDALLGGTHTRVSHAFVMVPFLLLLVVALWSLHTRWSAWFATIAAFWPADAFIVEFKFDVVAAALLVLGVVFALRERWLLSGVLLGIGAAVKWAPALTAAALCLWLVVDGSRRPAARLACGAVGAFLLVNVPFLAWAPHQVLDAYTTQGGRGITGESLPYLPLRALGLAHASALYAPAAVPGWANATAIAVQLLAILATFAAVVAVRQRPRAALSAAALSPVLFLVLNRVFSAQYLILLVAAWFVAGSLLARDRRDQLLLAVLVLSASVANHLVYPTYAPKWQFFSGVLFLFALGATAWVFLRLERRRGRVSAAAYTDDGRAEVALPSA